VKSLEVLASLGAKASIYQLEPLGTGHAIMCAKESLSGPAVIAYADTLIRADFDLDPQADAVILLNSRSGSLWRSKADAMKL
jgi:glucose-1-phosphate thymidylyltransferase